MTQYECPVCRVRSSPNHHGDRHLTKCRLFGNNDIGILRRAHESQSVTEPVTPPVTEPLPASVCEHGIQHSKAACKQQRYRERKAS